MHGTMNIKLVAVCCEWIHSLGKNRDFLNIKAWSTSR